MLENLDLAGLFEKLTPIRAYLSYFIALLKKIIQMISDYAGINSPFDELPEETTA